MRESFRDQLDQIGDALIEMTRLTGSAVGHATSALLDADLELAEKVISADAEIDLIQRQTEKLAIDLLARQQPVVASDLRVVVTGLRMMADLERMGDLAEHIAKVARRRYPEVAVPPQARSTILEMGQTAQRVVEKAGSVIAGPDVEGAVQLEADDDVMDALHRSLFRLLLDPESTLSTEAAIDLTLLGRFYERFADHAVSVARRVVYLVTGEYADEPSALSST